MANTGQGRFPLQSPFVSDQGALLGVFHPSANTADMKTALNDFFFEAASGAVTGQIKVYLSGSFVAKPVKWWNGSAHVTKPLKVWNGSSWVATNY